MRSSFIGCWLGITPGGAIAASFMGYNLAKRFAKDPESFGKGHIDLAGHRQSAGGGAKRQHMKSQFDQCLSSVVSP